MEMSLGRFGDRRLQKGGPFCWAVSSKSVAKACVSGGWAATVPARSG